MHLSYIYIFSFGVLKNIGLSFDSNYSFEMVEGVLHIDKRENSLPQHFWGSGIFGLTAIVGDNGSGKTTTLRLIKKLLVKGEPRDAGVDVIIVYEKDGHLYLYNPTNQPIKLSRKLTVHKIKDRKSIDVLYYSGHFQPYTGSNGDLELSGSYNASDGWLLVKDLQDYSNVDTVHLTSPLYNHLQAYIAQNHYRICELLTLEGLDELLETVRLPIFVQIAPNTGGLSAIILNRFERQDIIIPEEHVRLKDLRERALDKLVYYNIVSFIAESKADRKDLICFLEKWMSLSIGNEGVIAALENLLKETPWREEKEPLNALLYVLRRVVEFCEFDQVSGTFFINVRQNPMSLKLLMNDVLKNKYYLTAKFFDIYYSHNLQTHTCLSSGEQELLNLLSRLYYGITVMPQKFGNIDSPTLLLLDEAEIGFHPAWQMKFVKIITEFMKYMVVKAGVDFQIVLTSHSPIILSDIPVVCVNFLHKVDNVTTLLRGEHETFGENVFNLYRRAFFMDEGLVGSFAQNVIEQLVKDIENGVSDDTIPLRIRMIGDEQIKNYLMMQFAAIDKLSAIRLLEEQIDLIKKG